MIGRLMLRDIKCHKLMSAVTVLFVSSGVCLIVLAAVLFTDLLGAVDGLMEQAKTPDYLQMHAGEIEQQQIEAFVRKHPEIEGWQICQFLNLENSTLTLGDSSLADSTQDNGLCTQGREFDYLLGMDNELPDVKEGEVYVPVCYRSLYDLGIGEKMEIGNQSLVIVGFLRDSQMNSMMASSKRFLVAQSDYEQLKEQGEVEYLIEFVFRERADADSIAAEYAQAGLYANGPTITKPLIRQMNALSDGIMIMVILLAGVALLLISLLCILFITAIGMEQDRKDVGLLKALGIKNERIQFLYFSKYLLLSACGALIGFIGARLLQVPLSEKLHELYGADSSGLLTTIIALAAVLLVLGLILLFIWCELKKLRKMTALAALLLPETQGEKVQGKQYVMIGFVAVICTFLVLIPQNLSSTMSASEFVTYMGIGDAQIRMDVRQSEKIEQITKQLEKNLSTDTLVANYAVLETVSCPIVLQDKTQINLAVETGDHSVFPVSYREGHLPAEAGEIALSALQAQELGLTVGDMLQMEPGGVRQTVTVCGIYSDITNGGKTAKASTAALIGKEDVPIMWSVLYVSLKDGVFPGQWMESYGGCGADIVDISDYVQSTYGQVLEQIELAKTVTCGTAAIILFAVTLLFMRLIVEKNRYSVSLRKALGFTGTDIRKSYLLKGLIPVVAGAAVGLPLGNTLGENVCGLVLRFFGADGFQFVIRWEQVLLVPVALTVIAVASIWLGIWKIQKINAYECCTRKG